MNIDFFMFNLVNFSFHFFFFFLVSLTSRGNDYAIKETRRYMISFCVFHFYVLQWLHWGRIEAGRRLNSLGIRLFFFG